MAWSCRSRDGPIASGGGGAWLAALRETSVAILGLPGLEQRRSHYPSDPGGHEYFRTSALAADRDGALVAVGDDGGSDETAMGMTLRSGPPKVTLIDVEKNATVAEITDERAHRLMFDPWRGRLLVVTYGDVAVYRPDGPPVRRFRPYAEGLGSYVRALAITERWLITTAASHTPSAPAALDVWDPETLAPVASVPVPGGRAPEWIVPSPDGRTLLTPEQSADSSRWGIRVWSLRD